MKVFISWSGERSRAVAELLKEWISCVLQAAKPWVSTTDIDRGAIWFGEINDQLKDTSNGIICLTAENKERPWVMFEAGALAKGLSTGRVCPLLIDLQPSDVKDPLGQFNLTSPNADGMFKLVSTLNNALGEAKLDMGILRQVFDTYWPQFEVKFAAALVAYPQTSAPKPITENELLREILNTTRSLSSRITRMESASSEAKSTASLLMDETSRTVSHLAERARDLWLSGLTTFDISNMFEKEGYPKIVIKHALNLGAHGRIEKGDS